MKPIEEIDAGPKEKKAKKGMVIKKKEKPLGPRRVRRGNWGGKTQGQGKNRSTQKKKN